MRADKKRARHSFARRKLRAEARSFAGREWRSLAVVVAITGLSLVPTALQGPYLRGITQAFFVMLMIGAVALVFAVRTHAWTTLCGAWAEDNTRDEVIEARKRRDVWCQVSNIEVGGRDIDHVVITPRSVLALESKWALAPVDLDKCREHVTQAVRGARLLESILRSTTVRRHREVVPVVVLWGKGARSLPDAGVNIDGVTVVHGSALAALLRDYRTGPVGQDWAEETLALLKKFDASQVRKPIVIDG